MAESTLPESDALDTSAINGLIATLRHAGPDRGLDVSLWGAFGLGGRLEQVPFLTSSIDAAVAFAKRMLPGWAWRAAECHVSDDAWLIPDFLDPVEGERLRGALRQDVDWTDLTDVDRRPPGNPAVAICLSLLLAVKASRDPELRVVAEQDGPPPAFVPKGEEMIAVPKSMMTELYGFFHETWEGTGRITEPGTFGEELLNWREKLHESMKMARYRRIGNEDKP